MGPKTNIVVGVSGGGRSLANLLEVAPNFSYQVVGVFASRPDCGAVYIAEKSGIPLFTGDFSKSETGPKLYQWIDSLDAGMIVLAGFIKKCPIDPRFVDRIINIHPSLLPQFGGKGMYGNKVHAAVLQSGVPETGATVHFVNEIYDDGRIIGQIKVPVAKNDSTETLAARVFDGECRLLPFAVDKVSRDDLDDGVFILD